MKKRSNFENAVPIWNFLYGRQPSLADFDAENLHQYLLEQHWTSRNPDLFVEGIPALIPRDRYITIVVPNLLPLHQYLAVVDPFYEIGNGNLSFSASPNLIVGSRSVTYHSREMQPWKIAQINTWPQSIHASRQNE